MVTNSIGLQVVPQSQAFIAGHLSGPAALGELGPHRRDLVAFAGSADERSDAQIDLALTWRELVKRASVIVGSFSSGTRCGLLLSSRQPSSAMVSGRHLEVIESVLSGVGQNCIAIDLGLAPSTVALNARQALESIGGSSRPSRVHPLLML